jgi:hypothetical protein
MTLQRNSKREEAAASSRERKAANKTEGSIVLVKSRMIAITYI